MLKNQLKIGVMLSYLTMGVQMLIHLLYTPVMLNLLGQSEYGTYQLVNSVVSYLGLLSLGFGSSYIRYYSRYRKEDNKVEIAKLNGLFMITFIVIAIVALIAGSFLVMNVSNIFKNGLTVAEISTAKILMTIMIINVAITFPASVFQSYITAKEKFIFQKILSFATTILNPFLCFPLLLIGYRSIAMVIVSSALTLVSFIVNIYYCKKRLNMVFNYREINFSLLKEIAGFSFFIFLNQIIDQINWNVDKFILGMYSGTVGVSVYSLGAVINNLYLSFSTCISNVFVPRINKLVVEENKEEINNLFTRVGRIQFIILMLILTGYIFVGKEFMELWGGKEYADSYYVALLLIAPVSIALIQNLGIEIQRAMNMHQFRSIIYTIIAIGNIVISIPLCKKFGAIGSAAGTAITLLIGSGLIMNIFYHYKIKINIIAFWKEIICFTPAIIVSILCGAILLKFITITSFLTILIWTVLYTVIYFICMWKIGFNQYEKELIKKPVKKLIKKYMRFPLYKRVLNKGFVLIKIIYTYIKKKIVK